MASTYSANLKIELQATGENSGTWGTITNTNLGTALEQAIVGYGNPNYASDANLTLTYTDTNAAQAARALVLNVTSGVSLTGTRELVVPTIQKQYIVQNNTTGAQSITVKTSAGTGITVPNGRKAHLYVNGTDVIYMDDYVDINGGAIDGTPIGANSASTGAFTTLSASGNITVSGGTANGVLYLNGSKVATSGSALTFDGAKFSNVDATDNNQVAALFHKNVTGGANSGVQVHTNGTDAGGGAYALRVSSGNTPASPTNAIIHALVNGNVGIGTTSPAVKLDVVGAVSATGNITSGGILQALGTVQSSSGADLSLNANGANRDVFLKVNGTTLMTVQGSTANVGIGTTSPSAKLDIVGTSAVEQFRIGNTAGGTDFGITVTENATTIINSAEGATGRGIQFQSGGTNTVLFGSGGDVGIGTTSPGAKLTVSDASTGALIRVASDTNGSNRGFQWFNNGNSALFGSILSNYTTGILTYDSGGSAYAGFHAWSLGTSGEAMRLTTTGLGIGTTSPASRLDVRNTGGTYDKGISIQTASAGNIGAIWTSLTDLNIGIAGAHKFTNFDGSATRMTLDASGNLGLGVTPSAWTSGWKAYETAYAGNALVSWNVNSIGITANATNTATGWKYQSNGFANFYVSGDNSGKFVWYNAPSGTAGNAITFTQAMTLTAAGTLLIGTTTSTGRLTFPTDSVISWESGGTQNQAIYADASSNLRLYTANTERARITAGGNLLVGTTTDVSGLSGVISDVSGNVRAIPQSGSDKTTSYTLVKSDVGKFIGVGSGGSITVPDATFATGDVVSIFNNTTGNVTLTMTITTAYIGGTNTDKATITLATRGVATILFISGTVCVVNGNVS